MCSLIFYATSAVRNFEYSVVIFFSKVAMRTLVLFTFVSNTRAAAYTLVSIVIDAPTFGIHLVGLRHGSPKSASIHVTGSE